MIGHLCIRRVGGVVWPPVIAMRSSYFTKIQAGGCIVPVFGLCVSSPDPEVIIHVDINRQICGTYAAWPEYSAKVVLRLRK